MMQSDTTAFVEELRSTGVESLRAASFPRLAKLVFSAGLTLVFTFFLLDTYWGFGFTILNAFLIGILLFNPAINKSKESLTYLTLSFLLSVFVAIRTFWFGYGATLIMVYILNCLAVFRSSATHDNPLTLKQFLVAPVYILIQAFSELGWWLRQMPSKQSKVVLEDETFDLSTVIKGGVIAVPLLILFIVLLSSADPLFEKYLRDLTANLSIDFDLVRKFIEVTLAFGLFSAFLTTYKQNLNEFSIFKVLQKHKGEAIFTISVLSVVLVLFLMVQAQYLFASEELLKQIGVSLSEYARRGYAELLIISGISLSLVSVFARNHTFKNQTIKAISIFFLIEVFLLLLSATRRAYIYQDNFGFTQARLIGFFISLWLGTTLVLFAARVLDQLKGLPLFKTLFLNSVAILLLINISNIDYLVGAVKHPNLGYTTDYAYISSLSADAWPGWGRVIEYLETTDKCTYQEQSTVENLRYWRLSYLRDLSKDNWHMGGSLVLSNAQALKFLEQNSTRLDQLQQKFHLCIDYSQHPPIQVQPHF